MFIMIINDEWIFQKSMESNCMTKKAIRFKLNSISRNVHQIQLEKYDHTKIKSSYIRTMYDQSPNCDYVKQKLLDSIVNSHTIVC